MRINLPIGDQLQWTIGRIAADPVAAEPGASAKQTADKLELGALPFGRVEAQSLSKQLVEALGLERESDLAHVTQQHCFQNGQSPMDGVVLWSLVIAVQVHLCDCKPVGGCVLPPRKDPLPELGVTACAGVFVDPQRPVVRDPLVLTFDHIAPSTPEHPTKIWLVNRSNLQGAKAVELPADTMKAKDGKYALILGDEWMAANGVRAGDVLEIYQTKGKGESARQSPSTCVRINKEGPSQHAIPADVPRDVIGEVQLRAELQHVLDPRPAAVRPENFEARLDGGTLRLQRRGDEPALEPFAKIVLENLRTGAKSEPVEVDPQGGFCVDVRAEKGDPMLVRVVDHSHTLGDQRFERRLTLEAGRDGVPMLATNPTLGADAPPSVVLGRIGLADGCAKLHGDQAVTPGNLVTITRSGYPDEKTTVVADADGCFTAKMPFEVHADDVFDLRVENPFHRMEGAEKWQAKAFATARLEIDRDASLDVAGREGRVVDQGAPMKRLDNVDRVDSGTPYLQDMRAKLKGFGFRFEPFNPNTGNSVHLDMVSDGRAAPEACLGLKDGTVFVTVRSAVRGGWPEDTVETHARVGWEQWGASSNMGFDNRGVNTFRYAMVGLAPGAEVPVVFQTEDGKKIAEGHLTVQTKREGTGSGMGGTQETRYIDADMATMRFA